jgi:hypothetical protein
MYIKVKRLELFEGLVQEADIIKYDAEFNDLINKIIEEARRRAGGQEKSLDLNAFLDMILFRMGYEFSEEAFLNKLNDPAFRMILSDPSMEKVIEDYLSYTLAKFTELRQRIAEALKKPEINETEVNALEADIRDYAVRLSILERLYSDISAKAKGIKDFSKRVVSKIKELNSNLSEIFAMPFEESSKRTKDAYQDFESSPQEEKKEKAKEVFNALNSAKKMTDGYPEDFEKGIERAETDYTKKVSDVIGEDATNLIKRGIYVNKNIASLIRSIFEFQYTSWTNEPDITREAHALRTRVNGYPDVSEEAVAYLLNLINEIEKVLIERLKKKDFDTAKFKGIHYDFNKRLPLYEKTMLPVTGKQIADDTKIMKFRKASQYLMELFFGKGEKPNTPQARGFEATGKWLNNIYSQTINYAAMKIGKAYKGREGEMKGDALSRLFMFDTSLVDRPKKPLVTEDGVAPGVSVQVPGSIGSMGPITPPTQTSLGSGDNFGPSIKAKKKHKAVMDFLSFVKEKKTN